MASRTKWYRTLAILIAWERAAWRDDRKFTAEDIDETLWAIAGIAFVWKGEALLTAVPGIAIVEAAIITGAVASYAIDGVEGVENYIDFITEPTKIPERIAFTAETIYEHKIEDPLIAAATWYVGWVDRRIDEMQSVWAVTIPQSPW